MSTKSAAKGPPEPTKLCKKCNHTVPLQKYKYHLRKCTGSLNSPKPTTGLQFSQVNPPQTRSSDRSSNIRTIPAAGTGSGHNASKELTLEHENAPSYFAKLNAEARLKRNAAWLEEIFSGKPISSPTPSQGTKGWETRKAALLQHKDKIEGEIEQLKSQFQNKLEQSTAEKEMDLIHSVSKCVTNEEFLEATQSFVSMTGALLSMETPLLVPRKRAALAKHESMKLFSL